MADTMQFDLVSPERALASQEATAVQIPGTDGEMTAMPNHAATVTTLRPGVLTIRNGSDSTEYVVTGGFAEISEAGVTVLAEQAVPRGEASADMIATLVAEAEADLEAASEATVKTATAQRINDLKALSSAL